MGCSGCLNALDPKHWAAWELFKARHASDYEEGPCQPDWFFDGRDGREKLVSDLSSGVAQVETETVESLRQEISALRDQLKVKDTELASMRFENASLRVQLQAVPL